MGHEINLMGHITKKKSQIAFYRIGVNLYFSYIYIDIYCVMMSNVCGSHQKTLNDGAINDNIPP